MREIEFRGKREDTGEWVYGSLINCGITGKHYIFPVGNDANESDRIGEEGCLRLVTYEVDNETVGQNTGLKDSNGQKIYEGDIVFVTDSEGNSGMCDTGVGEVESFEGLWYICGNVQNGLYDINRNFIIEVTGNIHDNPELLQEVES